MSKLVIIDEYTPENAKQVYERSKAITDAWVAIKTIEDEKLRKEIGDGPFLQLKQEEALRARDWLRNDASNYYDQFLKMKYTVNNTDGSLSVIGTNQVLHAGEVRTWKKDEWPKEVEVWHDKVWFDQEEACLTFENAEEANMFGKQLQALGIQVSWKAKRLFYW